MRGRGAADDYIDLIELAGPFLEMDGSPAQFGGERFGPLMRTVGNDDASRAAGEQCARGLLAGITRADYHHLPIVQGTEDFLGQFNRNRTDGNAAALDVCFG